MPCIFFKDIPRSITIDPQAARDLYKEVAAAVNLPVNNVEVHLGHEWYMILKPDGTTEPAPNVHVIVEWTGRSFEIKRRVAAAIHKFLAHHELHSDITFRDSPKGTFFMDGILVGPEPSEVELL